MMFIVLSCVMCSVLCCVLCVVLCVVVCVVVCVVLCVVCAPESPPPSFAQLKLHHHHHFHCRTVSSVRHVVTQTTPTTLIARSVAANTDEELGAFPSAVE